MKLLVWERISLFAMVVLVFSATIGCDTDDDDNDDDNDNDASPDDDDASPDDDDASPDDDDASPDDDDDDDAEIPENLLNPEDLEYQGAFRLPLGGERPRTFAYGGNAITFRPDGDPAGTADGFSGSLFIMGHDRLAYGELPNGDMVAEVLIPAPVVAGDLTALPRAAFLQDFNEVAGELFEEQDELPHIGMVFLDTAMTGPQIHLAWGIHFQQADHATQAMYDPDLADPQPQGAWFVGGASPYSVSGYMLEIPSLWANQYADDRIVGTGQYRDGGWSGKGPTLYAYVPWLDDVGTLATPGATLAATELLHYESSEVNEDIRANSLADYQHADQWEGAAWVEIADRSALLFAGTKGTGAKFWYGYIHPDGPEYPCVEVALVDQFTTCWTAAGEHCPAEDLLGCDNPLSYRGWWSSSFAARMMFYDPADLAAVATGEMASDEPQPYATLNLDSYLFLTEGVEPLMLGTGVQRVWRIGGMAYDRVNQRLYLLELFAEEAAPVVHVFSIE